MLCESLFGVTNVSFLEAFSLFGFSLRTPLVLLVWLVATLAQMALPPLLLTLLTACFLPAAQPAEPDEKALGRIGGWLDKWTGKAQVAIQKLWGIICVAGDKLVQKPFIRKHKKLIIFVLVVLVGWTIFVALQTSTGIHDPVVIGHRGSAFGVENTLGANEAAIGAGADYTEVDILLSADGVPMVIHDTSLKRLSGQRLNVYDLTAAELQEITLQQNGYSGAIPTLAEVVEYCEGKILLAVEYKLHGRETEDIVQQVMQVMETSRWQKDCLFLSMDYYLVEQMREEYPQYRTGYCVYGNVGQLTASSLRALNIDFLLVEEWMVSPRLLSACRKAWVPVYVWTVNDPEKMDDYLRRGVSGLVTDYPGAALEVLENFYVLDQRVTKPEE